LKIRLAAKAGFCSGVARAVDLVLSESGSGVRVSTLGPLVHNEAVVQRLQESGVEVVEEPEAVTEGILVIRTHGISPAILKRCRETNVLMRDLTCPRVKKAQKLAAELSAERTQIIICGDPRHPEVAALVGWSDERAIVVSSAEDLKNIELATPTALLAQTTVGRESFEKICSVFLALAPEGKVFDTLCPETERRQEEALRLAGEADAVVVVGGAISANTDVLVKICGHIRPTCRVADPGELDFDFLRRHRKIFVTAGASTPHWMIKEVVESMEKEGFVVEEEAMLEDGAVFSSVQAGEQVEGKVVRVTADEVFLDIGYKTEALLPRNEVYLSEGEILTDLFAPGGEIEVTVLKVDEHDQVTVSHKRLAKEKRWQELELSFAEARVEEGQVKQVVPAGMVVDLGSGIEGFMPGSLVDLRFIPDFKQFSGSRVQFIIIEYNREKDKVILSRKKVLAEESARNKSAALSMLKVGSIIPGVVRRLADFGVFVDVGGIDGLIHISELAWERVGHAKDVLKVGDKIEVKVLEVIPERERVSLSLRQAQPDPWAKAVKDLKEGQILIGKITRVVNFGAFVELKPGVEGLVHVSQIADYHLKHPSEVLHEGEDVRVKILEIKTGAKRISLSVKEAGDATQEQINVAEKNADNGSVTLRDLFGDLFEQENSSDIVRQSAEAVKDEAVTGEDGERV